MLRDFLTAASLANLCLIHVWAEILTPIDASSRFSMRLPPSSPDFLALIANEIVLSLLLWCVIRLARRLTQHSQRFYPVLGAGLLAMLLIPANGIRTRFLSWRIDIVLAALHKTAGKLLLVFFAIVAVPLVVRYHRPMIHYTLVCLLVLSPFAGAIVARAAMAGLDVRSFAQTQMPHAAEPSVERRQSGDRPRIVWFVFDGMDESTTLDSDGGHSRVPMPAFKRLQQEAVYAEDAHAPAAETRLSLPSYLIGRHVQETDRRNDGDLDLRLRETHATVTWGRAPSVFSESKALGFTTALAGWYLPYCLVIKDQLDFCWSEVYESVVPSTEASLWRRMQLQLRTVNPFNGREAHIARHRNILEEAKALATNPAYDVVFIHWPAPHYPPVYDAAHHRYTLTAYSFTDGYFQNLGLVDDTLAEVRDAMEKAGMWDRSTLIVTSDHPPTDAGISEDRRVPFVVKLSAGGDPVRVVEPLDTVVTAEMSLAILRKEICDADQLAKWLREKSRSDRSDR